MLTTRSVPSVSSDHPEKEYPLLADRMGRLWYVPPYVTLMVPIAVPSIRVTV